VASQVQAHNGNKGINFDYLLRLLPLIILIGGYIYGYALLNSKVEVLEKEQTLMEVKMDKHDLAFTEIQVTLAEIQRDIGYLRMWAEKEKE
jgi:hypothetical protein